MRKAVIVTVCATAVTMAKVAGASEMDAALGSSSDLPLVIIDAFGQPITNRQPVWVLIWLLDTNSTTTASQGEIRVRGNSSAMHPKKPYRLELQDDAGRDLKLPLLGLPKDSDWILYPAYLDKTLMRDVLAYELWRQMGH